MILNTITVSGNVGVLSPDDSGKGHSVTLRLRGHRDDVKTVVDHWRIKVEWEQDDASLSSDECAVDGLLNVKG
ncbi:MAG: hypothetical protein QF579_00185 [Dehalococcoidia bacterium]|jgi:hypothetical protein|nr:hypothetical protein [Dehalococcoidia bacterium]